MPGDEVVPGSLAFVSTRVDGRSDIFAMNPGGDRVIQPTSSARDEALDNLRIEFNLNRPTWSLDGTRIAFHRPEPGARIGVLDLASDVVTFITSHDPTNVANDCFPRWSPDSEWIAFRRTCGRSCGRDSWERQPAHPRAAGLW